MISKWLTHDTQKHRMSPARILFLTTSIYETFVLARLTPARSGSRLITFLTTTLPASSGLGIPNDQPRLWLATSWSPDQGFNQLRDQLAPSSLKLWDFKSEIHNEIHNEIFTEITTEI